MKQIENVSRRGFLKKLGISSTALVLGVQLPSMLTIPNAKIADASVTIDPTVFSGCQVTTICTGTD